MDRIYDKCCGIDVHKKIIVACLRQGNRQEVREFGATTRELLTLQTQIIPTKYTHKRSHAFLIWIDLKWFKTA